MTDAQGSDLPDHRDGRGVIRARKGRGTLRTGGPPGPVVHSSPVMHSWPVIHSWLVEPMIPGVVRIVERVSRLPGVRRIAVMPDVHEAGPVCVGLVVGAEGVVYPEAVGSDIGCGIAAVPLRGAWDPAFDDMRQRILEGWSARIPILMHRGERGAADLDMPPVDGLSTSGLCSEARRNGVRQLGTLGRGNHFLELQIAAEGGSWLMVHTGSRIMGQAITAQAMSLGARVIHGFTALDAASEAGSAYMRDVGWARAYASANRKLLLREAAEVVTEAIGLKPEWGGMFDADHNHVRAEVHGGMELMVHRKGANSAAAGVAACVPGAMGRESYHVVGMGNEASMASSSHGAGRVLARVEAARSLRVRDLRGEIGDVLVGPGPAEKLIDESPRAYRDVRAVMRAQRELVKTVRTLQAKICYKGAGR